MVKKRFIGLLPGLVFLVSLAGLSSCFPDYFDPEKISDEIEISPKFSVPIAYGSLNMADLVSEFDEDGYVRSFDDSLLYITFSEELLSYKASELIDIPDQTFLQFYLKSDIEIPGWLPGATIEINKEKNGEFIFDNNERIDSIHIKTATLSIHVTSSFKHTGVLNITCDNILIDGDPFNRQITISDLSGNFDQTVNISLDGHKVYLNNTTPGVTYLPLEFTLELTNSGNPILTTESCDISMQFKNISFNSVYGSMGDYELLLTSGSLRVDIFNDDLMGGEILFADPRFRLYASNSYGVPVEVTLSDVSTYSVIENVTTPIVFTGVNPFLINAPGFNQIGDTVNTIIDINKTNCNIDVALQTSPRDFNYKARAITNPSGPGTGSNFVTDSSELKLDIEVVLPLELSAGGFALEDTIDFDFQEELGDIADLISYLRITFDATNGLPLNVNMQMTFANQSYVAIDSLFSNDSFLISANLDANGRVSQPNSQSKSVEFPASKLEAIKNTKFLLIRATANTKDWDLNKYVKFYSDYLVDFKIKMKAELTVNSKEL